MSSRRSFVRSLLSPTARAERAQVARAGFRLGVVVALIATALPFVPPMDRPARTLEASVRDFAFRSRPAPPASGDVVHVDLDDHTVQQLGRWPISRGMHARVLRALDRLGAELVVIDLGFDIPGRPEEDAALARAIRRSGRVMLTFHFDLRANELVSELAPFERVVETIRENPVAEAPELAERAGVPLKLVEGRSEAIRRQALVRLVEEVSGKPYGKVRSTVAPQIPEGELPWLDRMIRAVYEENRAKQEIVRRSRRGDGAGPAERTSLVPPIASFAAAARGFGFTNALHDDDGAIRRFQPSIRHGGATLLHYGAAPAVAWLEARADPELQKKAERLLRGPERTIDWIPDAAFDKVPYGRIVQYWDQRFEKEQAAFRQLTEVAQIEGERFAAASKKAEASLEGEKELFDLRREMRTGLWEAANAIRANLADSQIPADERALMRTDLTWMERLLRSLEETDRLERELREKVEGRICFIGASSTAAGDLHATPLAANVPGVRVGSAVTEMILSGRSVRDLPGSVGFAAALLLAIGVSWTASHWNLTRSLMTLVVVVVGYGGAAGFCFARLNFIPPYTGPILSALIAWSGVVAYRFSAARRLGRQVQKELEGRTSRELVAEMIENPASIHRSRRVEATMFFSDLAGFTSMTESTNADRLISLLNQYNKVMSGIVLSWQGYLDKFIGDGIMAVFGLVGPPDKHARRACMAGLQCLDALKPLNDSLRAQGLPQLSMRIGINSGEVIAGLVGSEKRSDYTVMGNEVNLAARLEGANKQYGTSILISETTMAQLDGAVPFREVDIVRVMGQTRPVHLYEPYREGRFTGEFLKPYGAALEAYRARRFTEARALFEEALASTEDSVARMFVDRSARFTAFPPPPEWDGVHELGSK